MTRGTTRRDFLGTTALAGGGFWVAAGSRAAAGRSAIEEIRFACIGVGGKGAGDTNDAAQNGRVVALCDVDEQRLGKAADKYAGAKTFFDFRKMFDDMAGQIDAVTVSTPDHTHAVASAMAMRLGKHCFCQKPLTHSIYEARMLGRIARDKGVATQMGNQGTASSGLRRAAAMVRSGVLGTVKEVHVWTNRPIWPQGISRPSDTPPMPPYLHWDEWLGPAPARPYHGAYHPFKWRGWWEFGTGALGDMACHTMNMPFMALDLRNPTSVEAETSGHNRETYPAWSVIRYEFAANDTRSALRLTWYDGGKLPPAELLMGEPVPKSGSLIIGEKGRMASSGDSGGAYVLLPRGELKEPQVTPPQSPGHFAEWVRAIRGGPPAMSNFPDYAGPLTETVLLGNLAVRVGTKVDWDAKNLTANGAPEVAAIVRRQYRPGYTL